MSLLLVEGKLGSVWGWFQESLAAGEPLGGCQTASFCSRRGWEAGDLPHPQHCFGDPHLPRMEPSPKPVTFPVEERRCLKGKCQGGRIQTGQVPQNC